jgi:hypothetical protein
LLAEDWVNPGNEAQEIYEAHSDLKNSQGEEVVTAYAIRRSDGLWAVLLINKDPLQAQDVTVTFNQSSTFAGPIEVVQFSSQQYQPTLIAASLPAQIRSLNVTGLVSN